MNTAPLQCINGAPLDGGREWLGRGVEKEFLYDIVSNRHSGLDVDKMDYYARDQRRTLGTGQVDFILIEEVRTRVQPPRLTPQPASVSNSRSYGQAFVARGLCSRPDKCFCCAHRPANSPPATHHMLCWPEKLVVKGLDFFKTRFSMHSNVYTHKTVKAVEYMICDALVSADPWLPIPSNDPDRPPTRISQAMADPHAYVNLRDSVLDRIECSTGPELAEARGIVRMVRGRQFYKCVFTLAIGEGEMPFWEKVRGREIESQ